MDPCQLCRLSFIDIWLILLPSPRRGVNEGVHARIWLSAVMIHQLESAGLPPCFLSNDDCHTAAEL
jgi:hypothetical protein